MARAKSKIALKAQEIRRELKKAFPNTKFSVRSSNYSGGGSVTVSWTDFPTVERVQEITKKYQEYQTDYATGEILLGANYFVFEKQTISEELRKKAEQRLPEGIEDEDPITREYWIKQAIKELYEEVKGQYEGTEEKKKAICIKEENKEKPATKKQLWALHCITGLNTKDLEITRIQASDLISRSKNGEDITNELKEIIQK